MANTNEITEQNTESIIKVGIGSKVDPSIKTVIEQIAAEEERTESNVIERALKQSPMIAERLEAAGAGA